MADTGFDWSWTGELFDTAVDFGKEVLDSVFTSETAMSAISGAAIGGIVAAVTGEDVLDGAILGGVGGTLYGAVGSYMNTQDDKAAMSTNESPAVAKAEVGDAGLLSDRAIQTNATESLDAISNGTASDISHGDLATMRDVAKTNQPILSTSTATPTPTTKGSDLSLYDRAKTGWGNLASETKAEIIGKALSGGAAAYSADKTAKANEKAAAANNKAAMDRDAAQYERTRSKVGSASGARPNYAINPTSYSLARTNEPLLN